jgi:hypothetical protein
VILKGTQDIVRTNKDDARSVLLGLSEDITHTGCSHTNKHLNEFRTRDADERNSGLSSNCLGKEGLK